MVDTEHKEKESDLKQKTAALKAEQVKFTEEVNREVQNLKRSDYEDREEIREERRAIKR